MKLNLYVLILLIFTNAGYASLDKTPTNALKFSGDGAMVYHMLANTHYYPLTRFRTDNKDLKYDGGIIFSSWNYVDAFTYKNKFLIASIGYLQRTDEYWLFINNRNDHIYIHRNKKTISSLAKSSDDNITSFTRDNDLYFFNSDTGERYNFATKSSIKKHTFSPDDQYHVVVPQKSSSIDWYDYNGKNVTSYVSKNCEFYEAVFNKNGIKLCAPAQDLTAENKTLVKLYDVTLGRIEAAFSVLGLLNSGKRTGQHYNTFYSSTDPHCVFVNTKNAINNALYTYMIDTRSGVEKTIIHGSATEALFEPVDDYLPIVFKPGRTAGAVLNLYYNRMIPAIDENRPGYTHAALNPQDTEQLVLAKNDLVNSFNLKLSKKVDSNY